MRALVNRGNGRPEVDLRDVPDPEPAPGEALVEVSAMAVNRGELRLLSMRDSEWRPGQDVAGTVSVAAGNGSGPAAGTRVVAWPEQAGWAERVAVSTSHLATLADDVGFAEAATLPIAGVTALRVLRRGGSLLGKRVLVTGASGGVGRFAVELAARSGAIVTGVARDEVRAQGLEELGAQQVVNDVDDVAEPQHLILETAGGTSLEASVRHVAPGGKIVLFGNSSGEASKITFFDFRAKPGANIEAFFVYESGEPPAFGDDLQLLADMIAAGTLHPEIGLSVPWSEANTALEALANREVMGKAVLLVS